MTPERMLLIRAYKMLVWCVKHWDLHTYEGAPSVLFQSRLASLVDDIWLHLGTTRLPEDPPMD